MSFYLMTEVPELVFKDVPYGTGRGGAFLCGAATRVRVGIEALQSGP